MLYYENFKTQHEELIRQAEHERLVKQALASQPTSWDRVQTNLGKFLIRFGHKLQEIVNPQESAVHQISD
jgi:hypothetical protein